MEEFADYNAMPKYVVSTTLTDPEWNNTSVLRSLDEVAALKQGDGEGTILVHGSPTLAQSLAEAGLVDRYHLLQFPVTLGEGKRLFNGREQGKLKLVESEATPNTDARLHEQSLRGKTSWLRGLNVVLPAGLLAAFGLGVFLIRRAQKRTFLASLSS